MNFEQILNGCVQEMRNRYEKCEIKSIKETVVNKKKKNELGVTENMTTYYSEKVKKIKNSRDAIKEMCTRTM